VKHHQRRLKKGEISIMEEGEFSDDDDDMNGLQNNSEKNLKDNDTNLRLNVHL
jgi:hypothetical protein